MRRVSTLVLVAVLAAGCSTSAQDLPLPGSRVSGPTYRVGAVFDDALNLAQGAPVKVHGVTVGRVRDVVAHDFTARVNLDVRTSAVLHEGATARLRATTPLGELFVQIDDVDTGARLRDGAMLGNDRTSAAPTIEDTMTSASLVINGGGLGQLQTIVREANLVLGGHEDSARDVVGRMARTAKALNDSSDDIDTALDALADVSTVLNRQRSTTNAALEEVAPAARVLRQNTDELVALLKSIDRFGSVTTDVIEATQKDLLSTLRKMGPVFDELNALEDELGPGIDTLVHFAGLVDKGVPTDYLNTYLHFQGNALVGLPGVTSGSATTGAAPVPTPGVGGLKNPLGQPLGGLPGGTTTQQQPNLLGGLLGLFGGGR